MTQLAMADAIGKLLDISIRNALEDIPVENLWVVKEIANFSKQRTERAVILTVATHNFKIFITIDFDISQCRDFIKNVLFTAKETFDDNVFNDYILELGNSICGVFKRELGKSLPALGMSTPNFLSRESINYITSFDLDKSQCRKITYKEQVAFFVNAYFISNSDNEIVVNLIEEDDVDAGELELF